MDLLFGDEFWPPPPRPGDDLPGDPEPAAVPPPADLCRATLLPEMPAPQFEAIVRVTRALLDRRFQKVREMTDVASKDVNINPFLMLALAPAYNIFSPFEAAENAQMTKLLHGDSTAFGKFVEREIFAIFGGREPAEKADPATKTLFSSVDHELHVEARRYLATYKSGPWTMNQAHANEMIANFPAVHERTGCDIVIGIFYGRRENVNNKPGLVMAATGPYVHTLVGKALWEFVTGVADAHLKIFQAIRRAQAEFALDHGGKTIFEHLIEARLKLAESFRHAFGLVGAGEDMWEQIFKGSF
jgi:hypothetical protein